MSGPPTTPTPSRASSAAGRVLVSAVSAWEITIKEGKLRAPDRLYGRFRRMAATKDGKSVVVAAIARELAGFLGRR